MMNTSDNMFWSDINDIKRFTENTELNKTKSARKTSSIILSAVQLTENFVKGIKHMNAYDAASTIYSDANWIKNSKREYFTNDAGQRITIQIGKTYYIDYGKTFRGELAYFHHGLCIGKRNGKVLVIPITSGKDYFANCFHPIENPKANRKYRRGLLSEGFAKDCVLYINDTKYISEGRFQKEGVSINTEILLDIQKLVFQVAFPELYQCYTNNINKIVKLEKQVSDQKSIINNLKNEKNKLNQLLQKSTVDKT